MNIEKRKIDLQLFADNGENVDGENVEDDNTIKDENIDTEEKESLFDLLENNEEMQKQFQSEMDRMITKAIQTRDKKHQDELKKQEQRSKMTATELQAEKERELEEKAQQLHQYELKLAKVEYFKENNVPLDLIDFINVTDKDEIADKTNVLMGLINKNIEESVKKQLKTNGLDLSGDDNSKANKISLSDMEHMSIEEINKQWENL